MKIRRFASTLKRRLSKRACRWRCRSSTMRRREQNEGGSMGRLSGVLSLSIAVSSLTSVSISAQSSEWEKVYAAAKKEARVVVSIPTSAELRKEFETGFPKAFPGIELELSVARGASNINKIAEEQNAGVRNIDLHIGGTSSIITGLLAQNQLEPVMPNLLLAEVRDPKYWWGGHIWADNAKRFI